MRKVLFIVAISLLFVIGCDDANKRKTEQLPEVTGQQVTIVVDEDGKPVAAASSVPLQIPESEIVEEVQETQDETK